MSVTHPDTSTFEGQPDAAGVTAKLVTDFGERQTTAVELDGASYVCFREAGVPKLDTPSFEADGDRSAGNLKLGGKLVHRGTLLVALDEAGQFGSVQALGLLVQWPVNRGRWPVRKVQFAVGRQRPDKGGGRVRQESPEDHPEPQVSGPPRSLGGHFKIVCHPVVTRTGQARMTLHVPERIRDTSGHQFR